MKRLLLVFFICGASLAEDGQDNTTLSESNLTDLQLQSVELFTQEPRKAYWEIEDENRKRLIITDTND